MRTTLDLDPALVDEARRVTGITGKTAVIEAGLRALVAQEARRRLSALGGTVPEASGSPRRRPVRAGDATRPAVGVRRRVRNAVPRKR